jgi:hypothetical protein
LLAVLAFEAIGGFLGGPLLIAAPDGHLMQMPVAILDGVFADFLVPGLLLTSLAALNAAAFIVVLRRKPSAWLWAGLALGGFLVWFLVELLVVGAKTWAQAVWGVPVLVGVAAALPLAREGLQRVGRARMRSARASSVSAATATTTSGPTKR